MNAVRKGALVWALACAGVGAAWVFPPAQAAEFRAIAPAAAVLYDGPSPKAKRLFVAPRGMPVEVLSNLPAWVKVRDAAGDVMWVPRADLGASAHVVAIRVASVRAAPQERAPVNFQVDSGVLLEVLDDAPSGWLRVRHADGAAGYVKAAEVFGR